MLSMLKKLYYWGPIHRLMFGIAQKYKVLRCNVNYWFVLRRVRAKLGRGERLKVVFLADDPSKWKYQTVYEELARSKEFEPFVVIGLRHNHVFDLPDVEFRSLCSDVRAFYERMGCKCEYGFNIDNKKLRSLREFAADIVFFQEPWMLFGCHQVCEVAKTALTAYVPYSVEWEINASLHWQRDFHRLLFLNFVWNSEQAEQEKPKGFLAMSCRVFGVGHTSFDKYCDNQKEKGGEGVIYAPHFAFPFGKQKCTEILGTFEWCGREMLEYAKQHPEINWVWKPHPALRWQLEAKGFMTKAEVDEYYSEWERFGSKCYDGNYFNLFLESRAMITDCGSFLLEYAPTECPIIRPLAKQFSLVPTKSVKELFDTYYTATSWPELRNYLDQVVLRGEDDRKPGRLQALKRLNLGDAKSADRVILNLKNCLLGR